MDSAMSADPRTNDELLDAAGHGDESALALLIDRHRGRLERMVRLRMDRRLQGRVDPADVVQDAYLAVRDKFPRYITDSRVPFFLWLRLEVGQKLVDVHRFHLGTKMRDVGQEVSLHRGALPQVTSLSLAEHLLGKLTTASHAAMRVELKLRVQEALNSMDSHDREVLILRHFEELSNGEAAQVLGIKPSAAINRYVRALKRLKDVFQAMPGGIEGI
jgi:RNA polymerase sigma-70 factor, ECF subfamily